MVTDLEDIETAISEAVTRIERAVNNRPNYLFSLFWFAVGWLIFFTLPGFVWHSKVRYAVQYNTGTNKVSIQRQPHDCNFFFAPVGDKDCHYERQVSTLRWAKSTGGLPIFSIDEGKTWTEFTPAEGQFVPTQSTVEQVTISWIKMDED